MIRPMPHKRLEHIREEDAAGVGTFSRQHRHELLDEVERLSGLFEKLAAVVGALDFDRSESAVPETQDRWIEFVRELGDRAEKIVERYDPDDADASYEAEKSRIMGRYTPRLKALSISDPDYGRLWDERARVLRDLAISYHQTSK